MERDWVPLPIWLHRSDYLRLICYPLVATLKQCFMRQNDVYLSCDHAAQQSRLPHVHILSLVPLFGLARSKLSFNISYVQFCTWKWLRMFFYVRNVLCWILTLERFLTLLQSVFLFTLTRSSYCRERDFFAILLTYSCHFQLSKLITYFLRKQYRCKCTNTHKAWCRLLCENGQHLLDAF